MRTSISKVNLTLLSCFVALNLGLIVFMTYYSIGSRVSLYLAIVMIVNFGMITIYLIINSRYWNEHAKVLQHFSRFIRDKKDPDVMPQTEEFTENAEFLSLFKRTYVEHKLLKKDYNDFKKVFDTFIPQEIQ